jgi:DNA invertase Pin-like site-specific DNA recombinase
MHIIDPMRYGYATVSTDDQSIDGQVRQLKAAGCKTVDREVPSGAKTDRAQLRRLLGQLEPGDVLMVTRLDRLARSPRDLLNTLAAITGRKAGFRSLGDTWADNHHITRAPDADRAWRPRGIRARSYSHPNRRSARAKARGVKMGRKPKLTRHQQAEAIKRRDNGETLTEIARSYNVSHTTISRLIACLKIRCVCLPRANDFPEEVTICDFSISERLTELAEAQRHKMLNRRRRATTAVIAPAIAWARLPSSPAAGSICRSAHRSLAHRGAW